MKLDDLKIPSHIKKIMEEKTSNLSIDNGLIKGDNPDNALKLYEIDDHYEGIYHVIFFSENSIHSLKKIINYDNITQEIYEDYKYNIYVKEDNNILEKISNTYILNNNKLNIYPLYFINYDNVTQEIYEDYKYNIYVKEDNNILEKVSNTYILNNNKLNSYPLYFINYIDEKTANIISETLYRNIDMINNNLYKEDFTLMEFLYAIFVKDNKYYLENNLILLYFNPYITLNNDLITELDIKLNKEEIDFIKKYFLTIKEVIILKKYQIFDINWFKELKSLETKFLFKVRENLNLSIDKLHKYEDEVVLPFFNSINFKDLKDKGVVLENLLDHIYNMFMEENKEARLDLLITHTLNFNNIAVNILNTSDDRFERFFEKLYNIDKRLLVLYIKNNKDKITEKQLNFAKRYYKVRNRNIKWD